MAISYDVWKLQAEEGMRKNAGRLGVNGDFVGTQFTANGTVYTVIGLRRRIRTKPVLAEDPKQRVRDFPLEYVLANKIVA